MPITCFQSLPCEISQLTQNRGGDGKVIGLVGGGVLAAGFTVAAVSAFRRRPADD